MLAGADMISILYALATGYPDRGLNVLAGAADLDETLKSEMWAIVAGPGSPTSQAGALGDLLLAQCSEGPVSAADQVLINECYRAAFYLGDQWSALAQNPLYAHFLANRSAAVLDKWIHYFPIYERHLSRFRDQVIRVLEIGVYRGGGLAMLQSYLGPRAQLVGLDIDPIAVSSVGGRFVVEIGDQADPEVLLEVARKHGPFDIIIDDGGHTMEQQIVTVETLFPLLNEGGVLLVEDTHTSYWPSYGGGLHDKGSFIEWAKNRIDDMHSRHEATIDHHSVWATQVDGMHFYDSVVAFDKATRFRAFNEMAGSSSFMFADRFSEGLGVELAGTRAAAVAELEAVRAELALLKGLSPDAVVRREVPASLEDLRIARGDLERARNQLAELSEKYGAQQKELERTRNQLLESWDHVKQLRRTLSWRLTSPLRAARRIRGR
jgi:hypothetical protein